ncbi:MAG: GtrA family protein [Methanoregula sp.]|nr:GtrA family protein [Methanoregula sp.]
MKPDGSFFTGWRKAGDLLVSFSRETIIGFFLIWIVSSIVDIGLLVFLTGYCGIWYLYSAALSYCCGVLVSYILNKYFTFHDRNRNYFSQFTTFVVISVSCLLVNLCIIWLAVEIFSLNYLAAKIIATICAFFWNYYGQSRITFRSGMNHQTDLRKEEITCTNQQLGKTRK